MAIRGVELCMGPAPDPQLFCPGPPSITLSAPLIRNPPLRFATAAVHLQAAPPPPLGSRGGQRWFCNSQKSVVGSRDCGVFFNAVFMWVFSTDILGPVAEYAPRQRHQQSEEGVPPLKLAPFLSFGRGQLAEVGW